MKKLLTYLLAFLALTVFFSSCEKEEENFDESLLIGKWISGTVHYKYNGDHTGSTWDTSDDVTEADADQFHRFTWSLEKSDLTHNHIKLIGGSDPRYYTVTELTATTLKYKDDFGGNYSFRKE